MKIEKIYIISHWSLKRDRWKTCKILECEFPLENADWRKSADLLNGEHWSQCLLYIKRSLSRKKSVWVVDTGLSTSIFKLFGRGVLEFVEIICRKKNHLQFYLLQLSSWFCARAKKKNEKFHRRSEIFHNRGNFAPWTNQWIIWKFT